MSDYSWRPLFAAITEKLAGYENDQPTLVKILEEAGVRSGLFDRDESGQIPLEEIDPFSFIASFMKYKFDRTKLLKAAANGLGVSAIAPSDYDGVPSAQPLNTWLFAWKYDERRGGVVRDPDDIPNLWKLFTQARENRIEATVFERALTTKQSGLAKLTQYLFYCFPESFLPFDKQTKPYLEARGITLREKTWRGYQELLTKAKEEFGKPFWEISHAAWLDRNESPPPESDFLPQEAEEFLRQRYGHLREPSQKVAGFQAPNGRQLALMRELSTVLLFVDRFDTQIPGVQLRKFYPPDTKRNSNLSSQAPKLATDNPAQKLKVNSLQALESLCGWYDGNEAGIGPSKGTEKMEHPLNQILYGPPGTGKTYATAARAIEICTGQAAPPDRDELMAEYRALSDEGRISFITFHQSYGYEDFVEGIRPVLDEGDGGGGGLRYMHHTGVFKKACEDARTAISDASGGDKVDLNETKVFKLSLGNSQDPEDAVIYEDCLLANRIAIGYGRQHDYTGLNGRREIEVAMRDEVGIDLDRSNFPAQALNYFKNIIRNGDLVVISDGNHQFRAVGRVTGDYQFDSDFVYPHVRPVEWLATLNPSRSAETLLDRNFSQATIYKIDAEAIRVNVLETLPALQ